MIDNRSLSSPETEQAIAAHIAEIIKLLGEDVSREGLVKTPGRYARALLYATRGYRQDIDAVINGAIFTHEGSNMVIVKDVEFYSLCEHHILPFFGHVSIGYIPDGKTIGLSKLARIVDFYARRLQVQERMTAQICHAVADKLNAKGVIVYSEAHHLCMKMRGVEKQDSTTSTIETVGEFADSPSLRAEFFAALSR
ncbi:MAG: GTP cyclohydrolase I FolE [Lachnoclostridium sp.]|nr:GTP cyclohydrolase I FolE [Lachnoclostridium sp.]